MRICLIGNFLGTPDEGMKKISKTIKNLLSSRHDIIALNTSEILNEVTLRNLKLHSPQIVHYLHGPTIRSLSVMKGLKILLGNRTKTVVSATRPYFSKYSRLIVGILKPDLILTQSLKYELFFKEKGCRVQFMSNGVDCKHFSPVSSFEKRELRQQLNLPQDVKIILHVGHIKTNRKLEIFKAIQKIDLIQVIVVGGTTRKYEDNLRRSLEAAGIKVLCGFYKDISKIYKTSDLYVFPIEDIGIRFPGSYDQLGAIDLPLSIFEAMACNLPVITFNFGALSRVFTQGDGFYYADNEADIIDKVKNYSFNKICNNRNQALHFDWAKIISSIESTYKNMLH